MEISQLSVLFNFQFNVTFHYLRAAKEARIAGASRIIGIDLVPGRFEKGA